MTQEFFRIIFNKFLEAGGIWGIAVIILCYVIFNMYKLHRYDRNDWLERLFKQEEKRTETDLKYVEVLGQLKILVDKLINGRSK